MTIVKNKQAFFLIIIFVGSLFSCSHRKEVMRNYDINIIVLNKHAYQEVFRKLIDGISVSSLHEIVGRMNGVIDGKSETALNAEKFSFDELYDTDTLRDLREQAFREVSAKYFKYQNDSMLRSQLDVDILQPILFFTASAHFSDKFYLELAYHPPMELSKVFTPFFQEYGKAQPVLIELVNPYEPMAANLAEMGAVYHVLLKPEMIAILQKELENKESTLKNPKEIKEDIDFLKETFKSGMLGESLVVLQVTP